MTTTKPKFIVKGGPLTPQAIRAWAQLVWSVAKKKVAEKRRRKLART